MAKTIKFNLICDDKPIRNIEDFRENFSIEDVLELFHNGLLTRWLEVRGYHDLLSKVKAILAEKEIDIVSELIKIFEVEIDDNKVNEGIFILQYASNKELISKEYKEMNYKVTSIIDDYHSGYEALIESIIDNEDDMPKIKACINEIIKSYSGLFRLDYRNLYYTLKSRAPVAIFAMLMNEEMREIYLPNDNESDEDDENGDKKSIFDDISKIFSKGTFNDEPIQNILGENLISFSGDTDAYWKDIEPKGKIFMVIKMENTNFVRSSGKHREELGANEVDSKFVILNGIDYKSNNIQHELLYLEV